MACRDDPVSWQQVSLYAVIGAIDWLILVAAPARHNPHYLGGGYLPALFISALILGMLTLTKPHLLAALVLIGPALVLAVWTAPRGNNSGLWILWFPILLVAVLPAAACHWVGFLARRLVSR